MKVDLNRIQKVNKKKRKNKILNKKNKKSITTYLRIYSAISEYTKYRASQQFKSHIPEIQIGNKLCKYILVNLIFQHFRRTKD
jgi:hypothetical protein